MLRPRLAARLLAKTRQLHSGLSVCPRTTSCRACQCVLNSSYYHSIAPTTCIKTTIDTVSSFPPPTSASSPASSHNLDDESPSQSGPKITEARLVSNGGSLVAATTTAIPVAVSSGVISPPSSTSSSLPKASTANAGASLSAMVALSKSCLVAACDLAQRSLAQLLSLRKEDTARMPVEKVC